MKVLVNGKEIESALGEEKTLGGLLQTVEETQVGEDEVIARILVDGEPLTAERLSIWKDRLVGEFENAQVETKTRNCFAAEALRLIAERLRDGADLRDTIVEDLGRGRGGEAIQKLPEYIRIWDVVQQNLAGAARLMNMDIDTLEVFDQSDPTAPQSQPVIEQIDHLAEQLDQVKQALEAGDLVLLGDILDYEFSELADSWHDMLRQLADQFEPRE